jgi:hypothetical protein
MKLSEGICSLVNHARFVCNEPETHPISLIVLVQWYLCVLLDDFQVGHLQIATLGFQDHQTSTTYDKCAKNLFTGCSDNSAILLHMKHGQQHLRRIHHHAIYADWHVEEEAWPYIHSDPK